jgi:Arc/MetJ-type ribon-helix-helix transcriptional regulator
MKKSKSVRPKSVGRPATGRDTLISARLPDEMIANLDAWAKSNDTSRSEAIRRLVELGLRSKLPTEETFDEALDETFPASDPVEIGHSVHAGRPKRRGLTGMMVKR